MKRAFALVAASVIAAALAISAFAATKTVTIRESGYSVHRLTIASGDTVRWVWHAKTSHNVFQIAGPGHFHSPTHSRTGSFKHRFTARGSYKFQCTYHAKMSMFVSVR